MLGLKKRSSEFKRWLGTGIRNKLHAEPEQFIEKSAEIVIYSATHNF